MYFIQHMGLQSYADKNSMPIRFDLVGLFLHHHAVQKSEGVERGHSLSVIAPACRKARAKDPFHQCYSFGAKPVLKCTYL